ncbi:MAG: DUF4956 domain-containing protein [Ruminococcus sp.]|nr:DUF4956 domain-containing protein [Ruminococcus sp.]
MFNSILQGTSVTYMGSLTIKSVALCALASLVLGVISALVYMRKSSCTKNFAITIALLPIIVQALIMLVSENMGAAGIAALGVFSLVRYRSQPGNSGEILAIMLSMAIGVACGLGYVTFALSLTAILCLMWLLLFAIRFGENKTEKQLRISIPETLDYNNFIDDLFDAYTKNHTLLSVRTKNMGSIFELTYNVSIKNEAQEKAFLDGIRTRNGNLPVSLSRAVQTSTDL